MRLEKKRSTSKKDKNKSDVFHQWQGDWKNARAELVTADIMWFERARTHGLHVEMETGRWHKIPRERKRFCAGSKTSPGTAEHAIEFCPLFDDERRKTKIRLRRFGLQDDNIWSLIKKAGGVMKDWPVEVRVPKKRAKISEVNGFIGRMMLQKKNITPSSFALDLHPSTIADREEGRD